MCVCLTIAMQISRFVYTVILHMLICETKIPMRELKPKVQGLIGKGGVIVGFYSIMTCLA